MAPRMSSERLRLLGENSSGSGSASIGAGGSRYSTVKLGRSSTPMSVADHDAVTL